MKKKIVITLIAIILCFSIGLQSFAATVSDLEDQQDDIEKERKNAQKELNGVKNEKSQALSQIEVLNNEIAESQEQLDTLNTKIKELEASIVQSEKEIKEAEIKYAQQQETLEERIVAQYKAGKTTFLDVLLNSKNLSSFISNYYLVGKIAKMDNELLEEINAEKEKIEAQKQNLEQQKVSIKTAKADVEKENVKQKNTKSQKNAQIDKLNDTEKKIQDKIEDFYQKENQLEEQIKEAEKNNANSGGDYTGGQFLWPCPSSKRITSYFGSREQPVAGASTNHKGIDIGASYGSDILAAAEGTVVTSTYSSSAGNYIMLSHGGGLYTVYMHSSKLLVSIGQKVTRGQVIAKVGSTGFSTGNHLHFGVRKNGTYVNPLGYVK